jgi:hypothetical protein
MFRDNTKVMAEFVSRIPSLSGRRITAKGVAAYVKANPVNSVLTLALIADGTSLVADLYDSVPGLEQLVSAANATDNLNTLDQDPLSRDEDRREQVEETQERIGELSVSELINFKDEVTLIDKVLRSFDGRTRTARMAQFQELRRVMLMPESNFQLYAAFNDLKGA